MTTTSKLFTKNELEDFTNTLKEWPNSGCGDDISTLAVSPFITFYFTCNHSKYIEASDAMIEIHEEFERLTNFSYKIATHPHSERPHPYPSKRLPDLRQSARKTPLNKTFTFNFTDEKNHRTSPTVAGYFWRNAYWGEGSEIFYSSIQLTYSWQWWLKNREVWKHFVLSTLEKLKPQQVYSGFAMTTPLEFGSKSEVATWERSLATRFYGLDIDYPFGMHALETGLTYGIRPPTWGFFLSDEWRSKISLSRDDVLAALRHPGISVTACTTGQWIELGKQPDLYYVENGVPELPRILNKLLRPIRHKSLDLIGFGQWDGDPNERFSNHDAQRWMSRFDDDSDWPTAEARFPSPVTPRFEPSLNTVLGGSSCPKSGWWHTPALFNSRRQFEEGEVLPSITSDTAQGFTVWHWAEDQGSPSGQQKP